VVLGCSLTGWLFVLRSSLGDRFEFFLYDFHNWNWNKNPETCSSCFGSLIARWSSLVYLFLYSPLDRVAFLAFFSLFSGLSSVWGLGLEFGFIDLFSARSLAVIFYYTFLLAVCLFVCWRCKPGGLIFCGLAGLAGLPFSWTVSLFVFNFWICAVGDSGAPIKAISWLWAICHTGYIHFVCYIHRDTHTLALWVGGFALEFPDSQPSSLSASRFAPIIAREGGKERDKSVCLGPGRRQSPRLRFLGFINLISCLAPRPLQLSNSPTLGHLRLALLYFILLDFILF